MQRADLVWLTARGLAIWVGLSVLGFWLGDRLVTLFFPLTELIVRFACDKLSPSLSVVGHGVEATIQLSAWVTRPLLIDSHQAIPPGTELKSVQHVMHVLVPIVIVYSIVLAWPVSRWAERVLLAMGGVLASAVVIGMTLPFVLLGLLEIQFQDMAIQAGVSRPESLVVQWLYFCEMGGAWILAVTTALCCIAIVKSFLERWFTKAAEPS